MNHKIKIESQNAPAAIGPYSQAILSSNTLYCSGQIAMDPANNNAIKEGIQDQITQVMKNIGEVLKEANMDYSNIVKSTIFLKSMNDYGVVNEVYASYLAEPFPAREAVEVSRLPKDVLVEISVIAVK